MEQNNAVRIGAKFESDYNGFTYEITNTDVNMVKIESPKTGANWFTAEKVATDIENGVLKPLN